MSLKWFSSMILVIAGAACVPLAEAAQAAGNAASSSWEARWEGQFGQIPFEMQLKKNGTALAGFITYKHKFLKGTQQARGTVNGDGKFRLTEEHGILWTGQFTSETEMAGGRDFVEQPAFAKSLPQRPPERFTAKRLEVL